MRPQDQPPCGFARRSASPHSVRGQVLSTDYWLLSTDYVRTLCVRIRGGSGGTGSESPVFASPTQWGRREHPAERPERSGGGTLGAWRLKMRPQDQPPCGFARRIRVPPLREGTREGSAEVATTLRGGSGIRTHGTGYPAQRFSRPSPSSARPSLQESVSRIPSDYGLRPNASRSVPRRGWDLNPRDRKPGPTVFETVTFVRSVTPPEPAKPAILGTEY